MRRQGQNDPFGRIFDIYDPVEPISAERLSRLTQAIETHIAAGNTTHPRFAVPMRPALGRAERASWAAAGLVLIALGFVSGQYLTMMAQDGEPQTRLETETQGRLMDTPWRAWIR